MKYDISRLNLQVGLVTLKQSSTASLLICLRGGGHEVVALNSDENLHKVVQHLKYNKDRVERIFHLESLGGAAPMVQTINPDELWEAIKPALLLNQD